MKKLVFATLLILLTGIFSVSYAEDSSTGGTKIPNPLYDIGNENLLGEEEESSSPYLDKGVTETFAYKTLIPVVIKRILELGAGVAVLMLVYSGFMFLTAGANAEMRTKQGKNIAYAILGLFIMMLSRAIVSIIENLPLG